MPIYNYIALKNNKDIVKGKVEAQDQREARANIKSLGFIPTKVYEEKAKGEGEEEKKVDVKAGKMKKLGLQDRMDFTSTLQILAQSGIPIIESLMFIENDAAKLKVRLVAKELRRQIMAGATFADTIAKYPDQFGQIYIGLVKAGEDSGELEKTLQRLLELLNKEANIRGKVIGTLMYPMFVIILAVIIVLVMLMFVFPVFKEMFDGMGKDLPWITATLMSAGIFLKTYWFFVPIILGSICGFFTFIMRWQPSKRKIDEFVEKPQDDKFIDSCVMPKYGENMCLSAVGPYVLSPEALTWIKERYTANPESFLSEQKGYDFSSMIIAPMLKAFNNGEILSSKTGEPLEMKYETVQPQETWSDLGSQKDFSKAMKDMNNGKYKQLPFEMRVSMLLNSYPNGDISFNSKTRSLLFELKKDLGLKTENVIAYCKP